MASDNLALPNMTENQSAKEVTFNDIMAVVDAVLTDIFTADVTAGNETLTDAEFREQQRIHITGAAAAGRTVTVPAIKRGFLVTAAGANAEDVDLVRGSTAVAIEPGRAYQCFTDGTANGLIVFPFEQASTGLPYDFQFFVSGAPAGNEVVATLTATRAFALATDCAGSIFKAKQAATGTTTFLLKVNGSTVGDVEWSAAGTVGVCTFTQTDFAIDDVLDVVAPASPDATLEDITFAFVGERI